MELVKTIHEHTSAVRAGRTEHHCGRCPKCQQEPERFKRHDAYRRQVRLIRGNVVEVFTTLLVRLKCPRCRATFAVYPSFLLPHKRFATTDIRTLPATYVNDEKQTYRSTVSRRNIPYGYAAPGVNIDERQLSPSTVWRWLEFLARLFFLSQAARLPAPAIPAQKYRSNRREHELKQACLILNGDADTRELIFPHFATA